MIKKIKYYYKKHIFNMNEIIEITNLDTDVTLLYKYANYYKVPTKFINIITDEHVKYGVNKSRTIIDELKLYTYVNIYNELNNLLTNGKSLNEIQDIYNLSLDDMKNIYYDYYKTNKNADIDDIKLIKNITQLYTDNNQEDIKINISDIESGYMGWNDDIHNIMNKEYNILLEFLNNFKIINNIDVNTSIEDDIINIQISPITFTYFVRVATPMIKLNNGTYRKVESYDGIDIFAFSIASLNTPYIQYNDSKNNKYYKIYVDGLLDDSTNNGSIHNTLNSDNKIFKYGSIIPASSNTNIPNSLYMKILSSRGNPKTANKDSYMLISYNITDNKMIIRTPAFEYKEGNKTIKAHELIANRIEQDIPLKIEYTGEIRVGGEFYIYGMEIEELSFVFTVMTKNIFGSYLYIDETTKAYPFKKRLYLHLRSAIKIKNDHLDTTDEQKNQSIAWISLTQLKTGSNHIVIENEDGYSSNIPPATPYLHIKILRASSRAIIKQLQYLIPRLLILYHRYLYDNIQDNNIYTQLGTMNTILRISPNINSYIGRSEITSIDKMLKPRKNGTSKISQLRDIAPELIVKEYARRCQCAMQPIIIPYDDIPEWQYKTFVLNNIQYMRQIMPFPPDNPKWYFVCPNNEWPFPGVRTNNLENKHIFPFIPCCFKKNEMDPSSNSYYNQYYNGIPKKSGTKIIKSTHVIITDKLLDYGRTGKIPNMINELFKLYNPENINQFIRIGNVRSPNSLLHCVFDALHIYDYKSLATIDLKEQYIITFRKNMAIYILNNPGLMKQELYDFTNDEIYKIMNNESIFLDPSIYYRSIEEIFNINIYVFSTPKNTEQLSFGKLEIPRHKYFHARPSRPNRQTIIIFKYWGSNFDKLSYPQCEYIAEYNESIGSIKTVFGDISTGINTDKNMEKLLHNTMLNINQTIMWSIDPRNHKPTARSNIFSLFNIFDLFKPYKNNIIGQYIDTYGKCRGFAFKLNEQNISVFSPPTQPEMYATITNDFDISTYPKLELVVSLIDIIPVMTTTEITKQGITNITGLWYPLLDIETGLYIPIYPINIDTIPEHLSSIKLLNVGRKYNFFATGIDEVRRIKLLKRTRLIILQLLQWLYIVSNMDINKFINKYITISIKEYAGVDSSEIYKFNGFPRILPTVNNISEGIEYLSSFIPSLNLIENGKIVGYSKRFTDGLIYFITEYDKNSEGLIRQIPTEITGMYQDEYDFMYNKNNSIFINESEMKAWLYSIEHLGIKSSKIKKTLNVSYALKKEPYLYYNTSGNIYMIQNVQNGNFYSAINIGLKWYTNNINTGYETESYKGDSYPPHIIYGISVTGELIIFKDMSGDDKEYIKLLLYNAQPEGIINTNQQYAAILPMI